MFKPTQREEKQNGSTILRQAAFRNPDPNKQWIGDEPLAHYLEARGEAEAIGIRQCLESCDLGDFTGAYRPGGRQPIHPIILLGLIVYGILRQQSTLRGLERLARLDLGAMYLCAGLQPDHSTIGKFINRHAAVLEEFLNAITTAIIAKLRLDTSQVAGDGTVIEAVSSRLSLLRNEAARQAADEAARQAAAAPGDGHAQRQAEQAAEVARTAEQRSAERKAKGRDGQGVAVSPTEPEAVVQPLKNGGPFRAAYKPSILATKDKLIVGVHIDASDEGGAIAPMLEQQQRITGQAARDLLLDAGYFTPDVLSECLKRDINVLCPSGRGHNDQWDKRSRTGGTHKDAFRFDEEQDVFICPAGRKLERDHVCRSAKNPYVRYRCVSCEGCARRSNCCRGSGNRTIKRYPGDELKDAQRQVMQQPAARRAYSKRQAWVEPVFAELRFRQGLTRFRRPGLAGARMELLLHCIAYNLKRAIRLLAGRTCGESAAEEAVFALFHLYAVLLVARHRARSAARCPKRS
jgi:transposase